MKKGGILFVVFLIFLVLQQALERCEIRFYLYHVVFQRLDLPSRATEDPSRRDRSLELLLTGRRMRVGLTVLYKKV